EDAARSQRSPPAVPRATCSRAGRPAPLDGPRGRRPRSVRARESTRPCGPTRGRRRRDKSREFSHATFRVGRLGFAKATGYGLQLIEGRIPTLGLEEGGMPAAFNDAAFFEIKDQVSVRRVVQVMADEKGGAIAVNPLQGFQHGAFALFVQA